MKLLCEISTSYSSDYENYFLVGLIPYGLLDHILDERVASTLQEEREGCVYPEYGGSTSHRNGSSILPDCTGVTSQTTAVLPKVIVMLCTSVYAVNRFQLVLCLK
jgi:hypothetical protein